MDCKGLETGVIRFRKAAVKIRNPQKSWDDIKNRRFFGRKRVFGFYNNCGDND